MTQQCPYCQTMVQKVAIAEMDLRICPQCHATFLPAKQFVAIRRDIDLSSRRQWYDILAEDAKTFQEPPEIRCIDHGEPLQEGTIPDYVIPGKIPTCCSMMHLPPPLWAELLKRGIDAVPMDSLTSSRVSETSMWGRMVRRIHALLTEPEAVQDPLEGVMFARKLRPVLQKTDS